MREKWNYKDIAIANAKAELSNTNAQRQYQEVISSTEEGVAPSEVGLLSIYTFDVLRTVDINGGKMALMIGHPMRIAERSALYKVAYIDENNKHYARYYKHFASASRKFHLIWHDELMKRRRE